MSAKLLLNNVRNELDQKKSNLRCTEVTELLESLGFDVREGKRGGQRVFVHSGLPDFMSSSFNCGHGKNARVKPCYIRQIVRTLEMHDFALEGYLDARGE